MQHRTALITAGSIVGVVIAGVSAIAAGMGILDQSSDGSVGQLSANAPAPQVVDVYVTDPVGTTEPVTTTSPAGPAVQSFAVEQAGTVSLQADGDRLSLVDVAAQAGWTWELRQSQPGALVVALTNGADTYELAATAAQGVITANATLLSPAPAAAGPEATAPASSWDDDDHEDDDHEEYEDEEHEGADDDD